MSGGLGHRVAILADPHFHDLRGDYGFEGALLDGRRLTARSWEDTRASTRVFNESFAALPLAFAEIAARGIRHVVVLGDLSDDGQQATMASAARCLDEAGARHGLRFHALLGNHDAYASHGRHQSKRFLDAEGRSVLVTSDAALAARTDGAVLSDQMRCGGTADAMRALASHGFFRRPDDIHWESPFGPSDRLENRQYDAVSTNGRVCARLTDSSYLVEPEAGLWLLMIDANVFEPRDGAGDLTREEDFFDSTDAGWNALLRNKPFLLSWIADVHARAARSDKQLLCFSHYPVVDPFGDNAEAERRLFGDTNVLRRTPGPEVARRLAEAGMVRHFSGHMHVAGETSRRVDGATLLNVAVPSLVAFPPGFLLARAAGGAVETESVGIEAGPLDTRLVELYRREAARLGEALHPAVAAPNYGAFLYEHARALVVHRFLPREWPPEVATRWSTARLREVLSEAGFTTGDLRAIAGAAGVSLARLADLPIVDVVTDWYTLRHAQRGARPYIPAERLDFYRALCAHSPSRAAAPPLDRFMPDFLRVMRASLDRAGVKEPVPIPEPEG